MHLDESKIALLERKIREELREYEMTLREYLSLEQQPDKTEAVQQANDVLQTQLKKIAELQRKREMALITWLRDPYMSQSEIAAFSGLLRNYRRDMAAIRLGRDHPRYDAPFIEERRYYERACNNLEELLRQHGVEVEAAPGIDPATVRVQALKQQVMRLQQQEREELASSDESLRPHIKRIYRKAIDALLEGE